MLNISSLLVLLFSLLMFRVHPPTLYVLAHTRRRLNRRMVITAQATVISTLGSHSAATLSPALLGFSA